MSPLLTEQMGFQVAGLPVVGLPVARLPVVGQPQGRSLFAARYLNLRHRTDRKAKMEEEFLSAGLAAVRVEATTGDTVPETLVGHEWDTTLNARYDKNCKPCILRMSSGERGCAASHVGLWESCYHSGIPLLILEDDANLGSNFVNEVNQLITAVQSALPEEERRVLIFLGAQVGSYRNSGQTLRAKLTIWEASGTAGCRTLHEAAWLWQTHAYIIWPAAAAELLASLPVDCPADVFLSRFFHERRLSGLVTDPELAWQTEAYHGGDIVHSSLEYHTLR